MVEKFDLLDPNLTIADLENSTGYDPFVLTITLAMFKLIEVVS